MGFDLSTIESDISAVIGGGAKGSAAAGLAAGSAVSTLVGDVQSELADKGSEIGVVLGQLGLNGLLSSAASSADKSNTAQAKTLASPLIAKLEQYGVYIALGLLAAIVIYKAVK